MRVRAGGTYGARFGALVEMLDLVEALDGGHGQERFAMSDILPLECRAVAAAEGMPLVWVGNEESKDLLMSPHWGGQGARDKGQGGGDRPKRDTMRGRTHGGGQERVIFPMGDGNRERKEILLAATSRMRREVVAVAR